MEGVFPTGEESDEAHHSCFPLVQTDVYVQDTISVPSVFGPSQLTSYGTNTEEMDVVLDENVIVADADVVDLINSDIVVTEEVVNEPVYKRPRRAAAIEATKTIKKVLKWEKCRESSSMFRNAAYEINKEFDRATNCGRGKKYKQSCQGNAFPCIPISLAMGSSSSVPVVVNPSAMDAILSDDECDALKSDEEDNDDDANDSDDDTGSMESFVVNDDYISDDEAFDTSGKKTNEESQSESESDEADTCSDEEDENGSVQFDDDSDADASIESESEIGSDTINDEASDQMDDMDTDENGDNHIDESKTGSNDVLVEDMEADQFKNDVIGIDQTNYVSVDVNASCSVEVADSDDVNPFCSVRTAESIDVSVVELTHMSTDLPHISVDLSNNDLFPESVYELGSSPCNIDSFFAGG